MERRETEPRESISSEPHLIPRRISLSLSSSPPPTPAGSGKLRPGACPRAPHSPRLRSLRPDPALKGSTLPPRLGFGRLPQTLPGSTTTGDGEPEVDESGTGRHDVDGDDGRRGAPPWDATPPGRWSSFSRCLQYKVSRDL